MKLWEYHGKRIKIVLNNGKFFTGTATDYMSAQDNNEGVASIAVDNYELYENEIASIEFLQEDAALAYAV